MKSVIYYGLWLMLSVVSPLLNAAESPRDVHLQMVELHRKMLVLLDGVQNLDPLATEVHAARSFYSQSHRLLDEQVAAALRNQLATPRNQLLPQTAALIEFLSQDTSLQDGDRLAFADLADELLLIEQERRIPAQGLVALQQQIGVIERTTDYYRKEYVATLGKLGKQRGAREDWRKYLNFLHSLWTREELLQQVEQAPVLSREKTRGDGLASSKADQLATSAPTVVWGNGLPEKTVVLTFDDGPHRSRTNKVLDILKQYQVHGYFFAVGQNLGKTGEKVALSPRNSKVIQRITDEGHILANHSYSHPVLTKLDEAGQTRELSSTNDLIQASTGFANILFRPPYGSKNSTLEGVMQKQGLTAVMWNVDSMDWSDPIPESIVKRTLDTLDKHQRGILLFHDIHKQTVNALPGLLEGLAERGYKVTTLDGSPFTPDSSGVPLLPKAEKPKLYNNSWALVVGVNDYQSWPDLDYAVGDAKAVAKRLTEEFGFPQDQVIELYDQQASRENIIRTLTHTLADPKRVGKDDRVFIFYAGHGATRPMPDERSLGYLIPYDTDLDQFEINGISMSQLQDFSSMIAAKHVYFVMDSCYSGLALTRSGKTAQSYNYLQHVTSRTARQIITAGGADQEVADGGPGGHSVFTWAFLQALDGKADTDDNGYLTASEIGTYVSPVVASYAPQTPAFGNLLGNQGGDFVFELNKPRSNDKAMKAAQVAALSAQHDMQAPVARAIQVAQADIQPETLDEQQLDQQIKNNERARAAYKEDAAALKLFRAGKQEQAAERWAKAVELNPYNANIVNNFGFVLDKLGRNEEALNWYYRTIELDPKRTPVYLNLGDMMVKLGRGSLAIPYYERYLHLYPSSPKAVELKAVIEQLSQGK